MLTILQRLLPPTGRPKHFFYYNLQPKIWANFVFPTFVLYVLSTWPFFIVRSRETGCEYSALWSNAYPSAKVTGQTSCAAQRNYTPCSGPILLGFYRLSWNLYDCSKPTPEPNSKTHKRKNTAFTWAYLFIWRCCQYFSAQRWQVGNTVYNNVCSKLATMFSDNLKIFPF